jgi:AcrR family transcriptional regulator
MAPDRVPLPDSLTGRKLVILETTVRLMEERGPDGFTIDDVLVESDASASSLYHHFRNRDGLIAAAERFRYRRSWVDRDFKQLEVGIRVESNAELLEFIASELRRVATDPETVAARRSRMRVAAKALDSAEVAADRAHVQAKVVDAINSIFAGAQERGLVPAALDTRAYSAWFVGLTLSRTFTEDGTLDAESWLSIAIVAAQAPLRLPAPSIPTADGEHPPPA